MRLRAKCIAHVGRQLRDPRLFLGLALCGVGLVGFIITCAAVAGRIHSRLDLQAPGGRSGFSVFEPAREPWLAIAIAEEC